MKGFFTCLRSAAALACCLFSLPFASAQNSIFEIMERSDLSLPQIQNLANQWFAKHGTGPGSGIKHYERWLYERKFHVDENGMFIQPEKEDLAYASAVKNMGPQTRAGYVWSELGPSNWDATSSWNPGVGRITFVAVDPKDTNTIYVSSPGGGIWKSTDAGSTWKSLIDFANSGWMNIYHICIDPNNSNTLYASCFSLGSGSVIKSTNGGNTWSTCGNGPSGTKQVKVHPQNANIVFAAGNNGLWRSTNGGTTWKQVETYTKEDIEFHPANPNIMYSAGSGGKYYVFRSVDTGKTWTPIDSAQGIFKSGRTLLSVCPSNPARVYAVQANGSVFGRLYRSDDTGKTYATIISGGADSGRNFFGYSPFGTDNRGQAWHDMAITVHPANHNEVYIAGIICWRSDNGGADFVALTEWSYPNGTGYNHADVHALEWVKNTLYSGSDGGIYKSNDKGDEWTDLSKGLGIRQFYRIACSVTNPNVITGGAQDNGSTYRRTNGDWKEWLGADGMDNLISPTNADLVIGTSQYGSLYKTTNAGQSYFNLSAPATGNWVTPLTMHPTNHDTFWGGWKGIYRTDDGGLNWKRLSSSININLDVIAVAPSNTRYIYAARGNVLYRLTNGGDTFTTVNAPGTISSVFVSKKDPLKIWLTCSGGSKRVLYSSNGGDTMIDLSAGLPAIAARSVVVDEDASETIYVGMNIGVYYRDSVNKTWGEHATGLPLVAVNEVEIQKSGAKLRVATYGRGVWESNLRNVVLPCNKPTNLRNGTIRDTTAIVLWDTVPGAMGYVLEYKRTSSSIWLVFNDSATEGRDTLNQLLRGTPYDWRVKTLCENNESTYVGWGLTTTNTIGLQSVNWSTQLKLFPDPASSYVEVSYKGLSESEMTLWITDMNGRIVLAGKYRSQMGDNREKVDISTLSPGPYRVMIITPDQQLGAGLIISK